MAASHPSLAPDLPCNGLSAADQLAIEDMLGRLFRTLDGTGQADLAAFFAPDAVVDMGISGVPALKGRDNILAGFARRPAGTVMRHILSRPGLQQADDGSITALFQVLVYQQPAGQAPRLAHVCDTSTEIVHDPRGAGWVVQAMTRTVVFAFQAV